MTDSQRNVSSRLPALPLRADDSHKGTHGAVLVVGGFDANHVVMLGAPALAAMAALRAGCGLSYLAMPGSIVAQAIGIIPSAIGIALTQTPDGRIDSLEAVASLDDVSERVRCVAIGPGWGTDYAQQQILIHIISNYDIPLVIDADGLNCLARLPDFAGDLNAPTILTPHPGEFVRLARTVGMKSTGDIAQDSDARREACMELAQRLGCVVVLKGAGTVVSDGLESWTCSVVNSALATAGTGDVLTGIIASLASQFFKPHMGPVTPEQQGGLSLFDVACWGVQIHGRAADRWSLTRGHAGLLAAELAEAVPDVLNELRRGRR